MIYGAAGYTGRLMTQAARDAGLQPVLAGRDEAKLAAMAEALGLGYRAASLHEPERLEASLRDVRAVLHAAGPFAHTAAAMVGACLRTGTHYLDISGEVAVFEALARRDAEARRRRIMIMPGVGFDVVPSDCLAAHVARRLPRATHLALGVSGLVFTTRGSAKTIVEEAGRGVMVRRDGAIVAVPCGVLERRFDFGDGPRASLAMSWGDVAAAYYTTGIPNVGVYFEATPTLRSMLTASRYGGPLLRTALSQALLKAYADFLPSGPTAAQRAAARTVIVAEAEDGRGHRVCSRLRAPEAYAFTGASGAAVARCVLNGDFEVGFQTPARVYGADFILSFAGVAREDLQ